MISFSIFIEAFESTKGFMEILVLVTSVIAHIVIGYVAFKHNPRSYTNRFFFAFTIIAAIWGANQYLSLHQPTPEQSLNSIRWAMFLAILYSYSLFLTIHTFPNARIQLSRKKLIFFSGLTVLVAILSRTSLIFSGIHGFGEEAEPLPGPLIPLFALSAGGFILSSIYLLIARFRKARGSLRAQMQYLIIGVVGSALLLFFTNFVMVVLFENTSLIIFGPTYTLVFIAATTYAIVAHHLFDIRVIIRRTVVYSVLLGFVLAVYSLIAFFFSQIFGGGVNFSVQTFLPNIIAAILIAVGFDPVRRWLQQVTDKYLFKGEYDAQAVAQSLAKVLADVVNLDEALDSMMTVVTREMRISRVATLVIREIDKEHVVKRIKATGYSNVIKLEDRPVGIVLEYFNKHPRMLVLEDVQREIKEAHTPDPTLEQVQDQLEQFQVSVALPLAVNKKIIGVLMAGEKLSGDSYSREDLDTLELIGSQTALSIEKAKFYEEDKLKSEFISIASHELLTPTAAIEGYLSMVLDEKIPATPEQQKQYMKRAYDSSRRLADLVKDLLSISRIESGRIKIVPTPMDITAIIDQTLAEQKAAATTKKLELHYTKPQDFPRVFADPDRVMQVVTNLVSNAIKYTPKGTVKITLGTDKGKARISVTDSGIGISKEDQKHLFEKFHRIDNEATAGIMGTGLGLYIVKNIITLSGGEITVDSGAGKGSTFSFTLPVAKN